MLCAKACRLAFEGCVRLRPLSDAHAVAPTSGLTYARNLLRTWLLVLLTHYNEARSRGGSGDGDEYGVDVAFAQCDALKATPRLVYALARSALLLAAVDAPTLRGVVRDRVVLAQQRCALLAPAALHCALYGRLVVYSTPQKMLSPATRLSAAAVHAMTSSARLIVLDRHLELVVYFTALACAEQVRRLCCISATSSTRAHTQLALPLPRDTVVRQWLAHGNAR